MKVNDQNKPGFLARIAGLGYLGAGLAALGAAANQVLDVLMIIAG